MPFRLLNFSTLRLLILKTLPMKTRFPLRLFAVALCLTAGLTSAGASPLMPSPVSPPDGADTAHELYVTLPGAAPYRIPAIASTACGDILAFTDHRPCGSDIGYGEVDIMCRISRDGGRSWGEAFYVADGQGDKAAEVWQTGFGDAAVVADSRRDEVLIMCVCGKTPCWAGNYLPGQAESNPNPVARIRAKRDKKTGRWTFSSPIDVTESIYRLFVDAEGKPTVRSLFIGSGKICQSRVVKTGDYYRLYCAVWTRDGGNRVIYSDDFGETWHLLGALTDRPAPGGDEPKCEELPDGTVVLSSRAYGGRFFNTYTFTDATSGAGSWAEVAFSGAESLGTTAVTNSCNGEILLVPAVRQSDGARLTLALQSVPLGPGRSHVGIYFKALTAHSDYATPAALAWGWSGPYEVSRLGSAYSTMVRQRDGSIGFLFEESTHGADYTIVYRRLALEQITRGVYRAGR